MKMPEYSPENLLSTPSGYATPSQISSIYEYAKALQQQSGQPVKHWTQGVSHMVEALMGGHLAHGADVKGQRARDEQARVMEEYVKSAGTPGSYSPPTPVTPQRPAVSGVPSPTAPTAFAPEEDATPAERFAAATPGVPGATPVKTVPVAPPHPDDPYSMRNVMSWEETDPKTGERTGGGTFDPPPKFAQVPEPPGAPRLPPDAQGMVRALANPTGGQVGGPGNNQPGENAALAKMLAGVIRAGGDWREALALVNARQAFLPKYEVDKYGREFLTMPGKPPQLTGRQIHPGKDISVAGFPGYETIGPDNRPIIRMPGFEGVPPGSSPTTTGTPNVGGAPHMPRTVEEAMRHKPEMEAYQEGLKASAKGEAERYNKSFEQIEKTAEDAAPEIPQLQLLKKVISNPQFYSGLISGTVEAVDMAGKATGMTSGQTASLMQFAKKLGSTASLEQIREMGQQGAVRVPEMHMIEKSNYDANNTPEANAAVVELRLRFAQRAVEVAQMANDYADKHGGRIDRGFKQQVQTMYKNKPLISDDERKVYEELATRKSTQDPITAPVSGPRTERWDPKNNTFVPMQQQNKSSGF